MKKNKKKTFVRITAIVLALLMVVPMIISAFATVAYGAEITYVDDNGKKYKLTDFRDTQGHWAQSQIRSWADYNIINGYNGNFMPNNAITRCDLACIIDRIMGLKYTSYNSFRDLQAGQYYTNSMLKCYAAGYIQGDGKNLRPMDTATREEVATILFRVFNMEEENSRSKFSDSASISSWASSEVATMASKGFINGYPDGSFGPQNNITRAELITMLDNIVAVYITSAVKSSDTVTNQWDGNVVNNKKGMTFSRSSISENLYCTQSCTNIILNDTKVMGSIYCFADKMTLKLVNSEVTTLYTDAVAEIKGIENVDTLIVSYEGSGTIINEMPNTLILEAGASVKIGKALYLNDSNKSKTYSAEEIYADIAEDGYVLDNSPSISVGNIKITADNIASFTDLKPGQRGSGELKSFGILMMEGTNIPTLDDYDDKLSYRASYLDDYYREKGGIRGRISEEIGKLDDGETYTFIPYALNYGGMVAYGSPVVIKAYDFEYSMSLLDPGNYPSKVKVVLTLEGSNIPKVNSVTCYYDVTPAYVSERNSKSMSLMRITDVDTRYNEDFDNERELYSTVIPAFKNKSTGVEQIATYFGYKIKFVDGSVFSEFPLLMNAVPDALSPISEIKTGQTSTNLNANIVSIKDNYIKTLNTVVNQYGVVYTYSDLNDSCSTDFFDGSWNFMADGTSISLNSDLNYSVDLEIEENKDIHYAAYVRTVEGYYFGAVNTYKLSEAGTISILTDIEALRTPDNYTLLKIWCSNTRVKVNNSKILGIYDNEGNVLNDMENVFFSDYLVGRSSYEGNGSIIYLAIPQVDNMYSIKVQVATDSPSDAYTEVFETIEDYSPYLIFSNEADGVYTYNVVLPDIPSIVDSFSLDFTNSSINFNKSDMTVKSGVPLSTPIQCILTVSLVTLGNMNSTQSYILDIIVN